MTHEMMIKSLSDMLEGNETLMYPLYGTLQMDDRNIFGFFGLTHRYLLIAVLDYGFQTINSTRRIPLKLKEVKVKRTLIPSQRKIHIEFSKGGNPCVIRVSKKPQGFPNQAENLAGFIEFLQNKI